MNNKAQIAWVNLNWAIKLQAKTYITELPHMFQLIIEWNMEEQST